MAQFQPFLCCGLLDDPALCQGYVAREWLQLHLSFPCPTFPPAELGHASLPQKVVVRMSMSLSMLGYLANEE